MISVEAFRKEVTRIAHQYEFDQSPEIRVICDNASVIIEGDRAATVLKRIKPACSSDVLGLWAIVRYAVPDIDTKVTRISVDHEGAKLYIERDLVALLEASAIDPHVSSKGYETACQVIKELAGVELRHERLAADEITIIEVIRDGKRWSISTFYTLE